MRCRGIATCRSLPLFGVDVTHSEGSPGRLHFGDSLENVETLPDHINRSASQSGGFADPESGNPEGQHHRPIPGIDFVCECGDLIRGEMELLLGPGLG